MAIVGAIEHVNIALAILTYATWMAGTLLFRGVRVPHTLFAWLWAGYTVLYCADIVALAWGVRYHLLYHGVRLSLARLVILVAAWRTIWLILTDHQRHREELRPDVA